MSTSTIMRKFSGGEPYDGKLSRTVRRAVALRADSTLLYGQMLFKIITLSYINFSILNNPFKTDMKNEVIKNKSIGSNYNKRFKSSS